MDAAEFRAERERIGLTQGEVAYSLGTNLQTVKRWERGDFAVPADAAEWLESMGGRYDTVVDWMLDKALDSGADEVVLLYYRTQAEYDATHDDGGRVGMVNSTTREVAAMLRADGVAVRFVYPDADAD